MQRLIELLSEAKPKCVKVASLLVKRRDGKIGMKPDCKMIFIIIIRIRIITLLLLLILFLLLRISSPLPL